MKKSLAICFILICSFVIKGQKITIDSLADFDYAHFKEHLSQIKDKTAKENYLNSVQRNFLKRKYDLVEGKTFKSSSVATSTCGNLDFEDGNTAGWSIAGDFQIMSGASVDPFGGFPVVCPGGNFSLRLNDNNTACSGPTPKANFGASASKTISLTSSNAIIKVNFASSILEFPHPQTAASFFKIEFFDQFNTSIATPSFSACYASPPNAVVSTNPVTSTLTTIQGAQICSTMGTYPVRYYPWQTQQFNLSSYIGQNISIKLTANWCLYNYDWGYAYFDVCCDATCPTIGGASNTSTITNNICTAAIFKEEICTSAPGNINYLWSNSSSTLSTADCISVSSWGTYSLSSNPPSNPTFTVYEVFNFSPFPIVSFSLSSNVVCSNSSSGVPLFASPSGGTFSGPGVTTSSFDPWLVASGVYTITYNYTDPNTGCSASSAQTISVVTCTTTGIKSNTKQIELVIAPNPFKDEILIGGKDIPNDSEFILFNCIGEEILRKHITEGKNIIDTEGIPQGLYIYSIEQQNKAIKQGKLVKD